MSSIFRLHILASVLLFFMLPGNLVAAVDGEIALEEAARHLTQDGPGSGMYIFEKGEEALLARAWLTDHATRSIDVQYFIWSSDNIGILAAEALLRAAERGVKVRVLIDDLLIDAPDRAMIALNDHPHAQIRVYNPKHSVGTSTLQRILHLVFNFKSANQRMHDKTFTADGRFAITGGRNMADEYFDYNRQYNFRDRDVLLLGPVVSEVTANFNAFWRSELAVPVEDLLPKAVNSLTVEERDQIYEELHAYANDPVNFEPSVQKAIRDLPAKLPALTDALIWDEILFTHDIPGKNRGRSFTGGSRTLSQLVAIMEEAEKSIVIQSPYLVMPEGGIEFFRGLVERGVRVRISTNSLSSTDNLQAFSGYKKQRDDILAAGIEVYEFKPDPEIQKELIERYERLKQEVPIFAIHAKTMVVDGETLFVGTFNLDPRSAHLNTEVGVIVENEKIAGQVEQSIVNDMSPENSWSAGEDDPDQYSSLMKRIKVFFWQLLPLDPLL